MSVIGDIKLFLTGDSVVDEAGIHLPQLETCAAHLMRLVECASDASAGIRICDDAEMAALHRQYMGDPTTTDVMAFPADEEGYLGDIVVCRDEARRQAATRGHGEVAEMQFYVLHGLLHLMGYDDKTDEGQNEMLDLQHRAMEMGGVELLS